MSVRSLRRAPLLRRARVLTLRPARRVAYEWNILEGRVRWSPGLPGVLGHAWSPRPWDQESWADLVHPHDAPLVESALVGALEGGAALWRAEYRMRRGDGTYVMVADRARIRRDARGRAVRLAGTLRTARTRS